MNYIQQLSNFYYQLDKDPRIKPVHITLYMALFQTWNYNFFAHSFIMRRTRLMQMSRIGSKMTFSKVLRELDDFGYITYEPSGNTGKKPMITMLVFHEMDTPCPTNGTDPVHEMDTPCPKNGTDPVHEMDTPCPKSETPPVPKVGHIDKQIQTNINNAISVCVPHTPHTQVITQSKIKKNAPPPTKEEVRKWFAEKQVPLETASAFYHHYQAIGWRIGKNAIREWQDAAEKWMITTKKTIDHANTQSLHTDNYKNYGEPL